MRSGSAPVHCAASNSRDRDRLSRHHAPCFPVSHVQTNREDKARILILVKGNVRPWGGGRL
eukprot:scaffold13611_cov141-Isochrysis_galbana.AAC.3